VPAVFLFTVFGKNAKGCYQNPNPQSQDRSYPLSQKSPLRPTSGRVSALNHANGQPVAHPSRTLLSCGLLWHPSMPGTKLAIRLADRTDKDMRFLIAQRLDC
jgi:hypothetical protein